MEWSCGAVLESRRCFGPPFWISKSCEVKMNQGGGGGGGGEGQGPTLSREWRWNFSKWSFFLFCILAG